MSDLEAAAAALGAPEAIVRRSAEARAKATGTSVDEVLAAWAGGEAPPPGAVTSAAAPAPPPPASEPEPEQPQAPVATVTAPSPPVVPQTAALPADDFPPPVLVGSRENLGGLVAGVVGLLLLSVLLGVVMPGMLEPGNGVRSSAIAFSPAALEGSQVYLEQGCGSCHTQMIRNVVSDFGLGPVTLSDTNQVIGYRRYGPDLAAVGNRITDSAALTSMLGGADGHPGVSALSDVELANLTTYLQESR